MIFYLREARNLYDDLINEVLAGIKRKEGKEFDVTFVEADVAIIYAVRCLLSLFPAFRHLTPYYRTPSTERRSSPSTMWASCVLSRWRVASTIPSLRSVVL